MPTRGVYPSGQGTPHGNLPLSDVQYRQLTMLVALHREIIDSRSETVRLNIGEDEGVTGKEFFAFSQAISIVQFVIKKT